MARRNRLPATLPALPSLGRKKRLPDLPVLSANPRGGVVKEEPIQPTFEEYRQSWFWEKYQQSSYPEFLTYWALQKLGLKFGEDYQYQVPELGQFVREAGSTIVDFVVTNRWPYLALPVQGLFWHPAHGEKFEIDLTIMRRLQQEKGMEVIPLDEDDLLLNALFYTKEALAGRDYSRYRGRI